ALPPTRIGAVAGGGPTWLTAGCAVAGEPRQPARCRQEREALVVRQPAVRHLEREAASPPLPEGAPLSPPHDRLDCRSQRRLAGGRQGVLPDLLRAQQRRPRDR